MKKRALSSIFATVIAFGVLAMSASAASYKEEIPFQFDGGSEFCDGIAWVSLNGKWGYIDKTGKEFTQYKYHVSPESYYYGEKIISEGLIQVKVGDYQSGFKFGFIDKTSKEVIPLKYDGVKSFSNGLAAVKLNDKWGFIDRAGKDVIALKYDDVRTFSDGLAAVNLNSKWGFIDTTGKEVVPLKYDDAYDFTEGLAWVMQDGKVGYIDKVGKEVVPTKYEYDYWTYSFSEGFAVVVLDGKYGYIDKNGNEVIPPNYRSAGSFNEGMAWYAIRNSQGGLTYGFLGREAILPMYDGVSQFSEGRAWVSLNGKVGFIDTTGKEVIPLKYDSAEIFSGGYAVVELNGKYGFIDKNGNEVVPLKYEYATSFSEGMAMVKLNGKAGYVSIAAEADPLDGADDWAKAELTEAMSRGLTLDNMIGNWEKPTNRLLAAEAIVKLIETATGKSIDAIAAENNYDMTDGFSDTNSKAATFLKASGVSNGVGNNMYDPNGTYTRAQMVTMLGRTAENVLGINLSNSQPGSATFTDVPNFADAYVGWAVDVGITNGVGGGLFDSDGTLQNQHTGVFSNRAFSVFEG